MIYGALVVGGPLNGQRLAHTSQTVLTDGEHYSFGPIYLDHNNELNVWTPAGQSRLETLRKLLEHYKP
jgi:hypothetical protein